MSLPSYLAGPRASDTAQALSRLDMEDRSVRHTARETGDRTAHSPGNLEPGPRSYCVGTFAPTLSRSFISTMKNRSPHKEGSL